MIDPKFNLTAGNFPRLFLSIKSIICLLLSLSFNIFYSQKYADYTLTENVNDFKFIAEGKLYINNKNQVKFVLSPFGSLLTKENKLFKSNDNLLIDEKEPCKDSLIYLTDFSKKNSINLLYDKSCETKTLISEKLQNVKWSFDKSEFKYKNYTVKKAKALINDRTWIVFYSTKIKSKGNPWRFYGLPGLLIKAEDEEKEYVFELKKYVGKVKPNDFEIKGNYKMNSFIDFKKQMVDNYWKNLEENFSKYSQSSSYKFDKNKFSKYETLEFVEK